MKDYYKILGISKNASSEEIKRAFFRLAQKYHPDKGGDPEKFKEINEAYQVLSDKEKKAQYDRFGTVFEGAPFGGGAKETPFSEGFDFSSFGFGSNFDTSVFEEIFEDFFGTSPFARERGPRKKKGQDIFIDITITLEEAFTGVKREIVLEKFNICPKCKGSGTEPGTKLKTCPSCRGAGRVKAVHQTFLGTFTRTNICPQCQGFGKIPEKNCTRCNGQGRTREEKKISISIPSGISDRERILVEGEGEAGARGQSSGNLYVRVHLAEHPYFLRRGDDIYFNIDVNFSQAALGDKVDIPTLAGKVELQIPSGTQAGKLLKLRGMGMPHLNRRGKGDMYVKINVKTPARLTKEQKELIRKLREEGL